MKVALVYPPPWKIADPGASEALAHSPHASLAAPAVEDGPPEDYREGDLDGDFYQTPYGLFALGGVALRAGHQVKVINLSAFPWNRVEEVLGTLAADVYGFSCWTANRRGVALAAAAVKRLVPRAHVIVGGPHATPFAREMLEHYPAIDAIASGESDLTFIEVLDRLARNESLVGTPGLFARRKEGPSSMGEIVEGPERKQIQDLDLLPCPHEHFATHIVMTSRGCPWACTFCGAETSWGRGFRAHSVGYVVEMLRAAAARAPVKMLQIKDDTFTTNKKRVIELCRAIRKRGVSFLWSCDTRVDLLEDELLKEMRLAGCERLSLGVESGSDRILKAIDKKITAEEILRSTALAKKYGIRVRYYMMLGNRGETEATFRETLAFLERARPHQYIFSCLSIYPGTRDFQAAENAGRITKDVYFEGTFQEYKVPFDATAEDTAVMNAWFRDHSGLREMYRPSLDECRGALDALGGDHHAAHLDLGAAYYEAGDFDAAERHAYRAIALDHPLPGLAYNLIACAARARADLDGMMDAFSRAAKVDPQHWVLIRNVQRARAWFKANGPSSGAPLELSIKHDFLLYERTLQPSLPGPLEPGWEGWGAHDPQPVGEASPAATQKLSAGIDASVYTKIPGMEGSHRALGWAPGSPRRLRVLD